MIINNVNHIKLLSEFDVAAVVYSKQDIRSNMQYDSIGKPLSGTCDLDIDFSDGTDMQLVQSIIDTHDPTPIPPAPTKQEIFEQQITANTDYLLDVDFRLILVELGML